MGMFALAAALLLGTTLVPAASPMPAPSATPASVPIAIELCAAEAQGSTNPNLKVGLAFRNLMDAEAIHVEFDILLIDGSNAVVGSHSVAIDGKFSPDVLVKPRRSPSTGGLLTQPEYPDSPAWNIPNHFGSGAQSVRCIFHAVERADGRRITP